ncbi:MAG TPA: PKD domain-containing protein [Rhodanobacteraceae bacterium]|nr:PKD domain-containing protein [Rhodanobacteraceae bacterium]
MHTSAHVDHAVERTARIRPAAAGSRGRRLAQRAWAASLSGWLTLVAAVLAAPPATAAGPAPVLPWFVTHPSERISCNDTPFGRSVTLGDESEMMEMVAGTDGFNVIAELQAGTTPGRPFDRSFNSPMYEGDLAGTTFLKAVPIDLNGDGRDEVVTVNRVDATGDLRLGVFHRTDAPSAVLFDSWTLAQSFTDVQIVAGDLDGSGDNRQELGVLVRSNNLRLLVLTGNADGGIAENDNESSGDALILSSDTNVGAISLAAGDMLLDGHEQMIISRVLNYSPLFIGYTLAEYQPTTPVLNIGPNATAIGTTNNYTYIGSGFRVGEGEGPGEGGPSLDNILGMKIQAGNVADTAAAELVEYIEFIGGETDYIGMRLHHYTTERDEQGVITRIGWAERLPDEDGETAFDYSIIVAQNDNIRPAFDAAIANMNLVSPDEMIIARSDPDRLLVSAYKAETDFTAGFIYVTNGRSALFTNTSTGDAIKNYEWNFDDGSSPIHVANPSHDFPSDDPSPHTYHVELTVTDDNEATRQYVADVTVEDSGSSSGGETIPYLYRLDDTPAYEAYYNVDNMQDVDLVNVAARDMDKDGIAEIVTEARNHGDQLLRSVWHLVDPSDPNSFSGVHETETSDRFRLLTAVDMQAADFDGDSLTATLGTDADCRTVSEPQLRQVVWLPPYFNHLQSQAEKEATFGRTIESGSDIEQHAGSFTSHDISGYVGLAAGSELLGVEVAAKATAGYHFQVEHGAIHGSGNSFAIDQGYSQDHGEALVVMEENSFNCYSYDVTTATGGSVPDSAVRMCERIGGPFDSGTDAVTWGTATAAGGPGHPPAQWVPLQRDWNSMALFKPVTSNTSFADGNGTDKATDGLFSTEAASADVTQQPYLQIDLGSVRDISNIRIFPSAGHSPELTGFRIYASASPMTGGAIPTGPDVHVFAPETADGSSYDRWDAWTRDASAPFDMLEARYIRLQHPDVAQLRIAEIQVFGDVHADPPSYPDTVCDPTPNDGYFNAWVWDAGSSDFRKIEVRGDMLWDGTYDLHSDNTLHQIPPSNDDDTCTNNGGLKFASIWGQNLIGNSSTTNWDLSSAQTNVIGENQGFESAIHVGAEFDLEAGFIANVTSGASYEFATGINNDVQTTSYWTQGLQLGGEIGGFDDSNLIGDCAYNPRPYAYHLVERSITGYRHDIYTVDYIVHESTGTPWRRRDLSPLCQHGESIFADGFDD